MFSNGCVRKEDMALEYRTFFTVKEAHNALCLNLGFDPFIIPDPPHGRRVNKKSLAKFGYIVDPQVKKAYLERIEAERKSWYCSVCGCALELEWDGRRYKKYSECSKHREYSYEYDNGHEFMMTKANAQKIEFKCPTCGEYFP